MKKKLMLPCIAAVAIATFVGTKTIKSNASKNSLLMANVEALSDYETITDAKCKGEKKNRCLLYCGLCGTRISGTLPLEGSHSCKEK